MKKIVFALLFVLGLTLSSVGQMDTVSGPDGRVEGWYAFYWYDSCPEYWDTSRARFLLYGHSAGLGPSTLCGQPHYVEHPAVLKGVSAWVDPYPDHPNAYLDSISKLPEYVYVVQKGADTMIFLDRVRWDTAECKVLKLPINYDTARHGFAYCHVYTAYFDKPVEVDSIFYLCGTHKSNVSAHNMDIHRRTSYCVMQDYQMRCRIPYPIMLYCDSLYHIPNARNTWHIAQHSLTIPHFGNFMPLIDMVEVRVETADSTMGTAGPSGEMSPSTWQTIWARAKRGYRFLHWNDGDTNNPRQIRLMHDTLFTAYFASAEQCTVSVSSTTTMGHVDGGGVYYIGDSVTLTAVPDVINYHFVQWHDSVTANPRTFEATHDTSFTAFFERDVHPQGIGSTDASALFTLTPNPAYRNVTVAVQSTIEGGRLTLHNAEGRELWSGSLTAGQGRAVLDLSPYPSGVYFVTFTYGDSTSVRKLIVGEWR
ncbi:MAG: T9SS type A sorting domain-containing protein [Bacteroidales bacterium]|nr:T9SS type A sorting domain-containing protein [Bacteroidales bacterium]